ncbi:MAG: sodium:calcium antiporter [Deltaproteobacteria bacterium RIFCSPLOWO2_02_FULL_50_16]|nr:MAG: sodium:calcium antiporter [Deltaproteobacteria bacterium RIFCSPLOWO2_02_FULL_50_16]
MHPLLLFIAGFLLLVLGAEWLIRGAARLAALLGLSPLIIGLTIVAFGTSTPEFAIGTISALRNQTDLAFGNIVGSNICNIFLILGLSATVTPLFVAQKIIRLDVPIMIGFSIMMGIMAVDGVVSHVDGGILLCCAVLYTFFTIKKSRPDTLFVQKEYEEEFGRGKKTDVSIQMIYIVLGLLSLLIGSYWLVKGTTFIATSLGVGELVIGLTIVAIGTTLPELITAMVAAIRGHRDVAVGSIIGSNIINIIGVLGLSSLLAPFGIKVRSFALHFDVPFMIVAAVACLPIFFTGFKIARFEGLLFLAYYSSYLTFLIRKTSEHEGMIYFNIMSLILIFPVMVITLIVLLFRALHHKK